MMLNSTYPSLLHEWQVCLWTWRRCSMNALGGTLSLLLLFASSPSAISGCKTNEVLISGWWHLSYVSFCSFHWGNAFPSEIRLLLIVATPCQTKSSSQSVRSTNCFYQLISIVCRFWNASRHMYTMQPINSFQKECVFLMLNLLVL